ncbi:MAG: hypothetical protein Q9P14_07250 [candidate division KSB1 bacterium]|nr:hypothetical protein [candidate division KSB1 bacterium]MDQ7064277.1 hypothetical protein [candidate division KSB1 bacterium]
MPKRKRKPKIAGGSSDADGGILIGENDLLGQLSDKQGSILYLGKYTADEIRRALEKSGIFLELRKKGFSDFIIEIVPLEDFQQALKVYHQAATPDNLLSEARLRETYFCPDPDVDERLAKKRFKMLCIDWLMMQNPYQDFTPDRPPLPGQAHPGLGVAKKVLKLLKALCRLHGLAGILNFPEYFHNAYFYRSYFRFYNPAKEANLYALARDLSRLTIAEMSWAIELGCVIDLSTNGPFEWTSDVQILPLDPEIRSFFESSAYQKAFHQCLSEQKFHLDDARFLDKKKAGLKLLKGEEHE